jgi:hypothetical protein
VPSVYVDNLNSIKLEGLTDRSHQLVSDAVPIFVIIDKLGTMLTPEAPMDAIPGEPGNYVGFISADTPLTNGKKYRVVIDVILAAGGVGHWEFPVVAETRVVYPT